jgi:hypothetical protein
MRYQIIMLILLSMARLEGCYTYEARKHMSGVERGCDEFNHPIPPQMRYLLEGFALGDNTSLMLRLASKS